jgi:hypothetical protein
MTVFHRAIIFTKIPLKGYFRFGDKFQIFPAELENMPTSKLQKHHPVILEYTTTEEDKIEILSDFEELRDLGTLTATTLTKQQEILNLLTLFSNHLFFKYNDLTGTWGMPVLKDNPGEEANTWSSKWNLALFHWPELPKQLKIDRFSEPTCPEIEYDKHIKYYFHNPNFDYYFDKDIRFPNTIKLGIKVYYDLNVDSKRVIDSAISHYVSAFELRQFKKSLSIIAAFTAIETMVNNEFRNEKAYRCGECNQLQYKVAKKFRDFLFNYVGKSDNNKKKFNAFYSLRSKIFHTGNILSTENLWSDLSKDEKDKEFLTHIEVLQLSKISIIHWLLKNN